MIDQSIFENKKAAYLTLGCKLNFAETSALGKQLHDIGVRKVRDGEIADICVVNTCSVTELADKKCRQSIRKLIKENPNSFVIVTGCYAQLKPQEIADIEGVDLVLGSEQKLDLIEYLDQLKKKDKSTIVTTKTNLIKSFVPSLSHDDRTRYFLKVQDGCDYYCTFCTIPFARGKSRNGTIETIVNQAKEVVKEGGKEIVLTGVNIGDFGKSTNENFLQLIKALDEVEGIERFRISSIEPNLLTDEIIDFVIKSKRFAPHFHMPLQSGSDTVLELMHRRYNTQLFREKIEKIKVAIPNAFIGVDVIVGTRGETDELFEDGFEFLQSIDFSQLHVFTYSERPGTQALKIDHEVDVKTKHARSKRLLDLSDLHLERFYKSLEGNVKKVIFEHTRHDEKIYGFTEDYIKVAIDYDDKLVNQVTQVKLLNFDKDKCVMNASLIV